MQQPDTVTYNWLRSQPEAFRENIYKLVQLRIDELLIKSKEDSGSTFDFTKMNEEDRCSPGGTSGYASHNSTPLRSPALGCPANFAEYGSGAELDYSLYKWTSPIAKLYQLSVLDRQTSVPAARNLDRQLSDCSSATLMPSRQASVVSTASTVKMSSQLSYQTENFDENEIRDMLYEGKRVPKPEYVCHICHVPGDHMIQDCPKRYVCQVATPYQGHKQCYGEFQCTKCKRKWKSTQSWSNVGQTCTKCPEITVFPKKQFPIEKAMQQGRLPSRKTVRSDGSFSFSIDCWSDRSSAETSVFGDDTFDRDVFSPIPFSTHSRNY